VLNVECMERGKGRLDVLKIVRRKGRSLEQPGQIAI
jgi:hypothetical protein